MSLQFDRSSSPVRKSEFGAKGINNNAKRQQIDARSSMSSTGSTRPPTSSSSRHAKNR